MSDTPETDAQANPVFGNHLCATVLADFARKLERERDEAWRERDQLLEAAKAVVARWEMPSWKDTEPTAIVIYRLRDVVEAMSTQESTVE